MPISSLRLATRRRGKIVIFLLESKLFLPIAKARMKAQKTFCRLPVDLA
jgi:hypothetical protein